ncbi:MAG: acyl-CoA thioesterase [Cyanobium sp.]
MPHPPAAGEPRQPWRLRRRVLPQHTDHAGVVWHGAYVGWLEEARVEALAAAGLAYGELSARGLELPVVSLAIDYRQALLHGEAVEILSWADPRCGVKLPWRSQLLGADGRLAAEARVELVLVAMAGGGGRRLQRRLPADLEEAVRRLIEGPAGVVQMY